MWSVLERLQSEHGNLSRLANLLEERARRVLPPQRNDLELMVDTMYYLTNFPDVYLHPMEDQIVQHLRDVDGIPADFADDLASQHATLAEQGQDLLRDLESVAREETLSWINIAPNLRLYAERLRHNMVVEELILFPAAACKLGVDERFSIETTHNTAAKEDPLFGASVEERFRELRRVIAAEAGCGCDNPPS